MGVNGWGLVAVGGRPAGLAWIALGAAALAMAGCTVDDEALDGPGVQRAGEVPGAVDPARAPSGPSNPPTAPTTASAPPATAAPTPSTVPVIIRAEKITVDTLVARLVHAEKIEANSMTVDDLRQEQNPETWASEVASHQLAMATLEADTVYAKEIFVRDLRAKVVLAKKAEIKPSSSGPTPPPSGGGGSDDDDDDDDDDGEAGGGGQEKSGMGEGKGKEGKGGEGKGGEGKGGEGNGKK